MTASQWFSPDALLLSLLFVRLLMGQCAPQVADYLILGPGKTRRERMQVRAGTCCAHSHAVQDVHKLCSSKLGCVYCIISQHSAQTDAPAESSLP